MINKIEKKYKLTYGFEIEGYINYRLYDQLKRLQSDGLCFGAKCDGSVNFDRDELERLDDVQDSYSEYVLGIFKSKDNLLQTLRLFKNGVNYLNNESTGLHLHVGMDGDTRALFNDWDFIGRLQKFFRLGDGVCDCIHERYRHNDYCEPYLKRQQVNELASYQDLKQFLYEWNDRKKYRLMRNHPQGTLEFRIFSCCQHKEQNIKNFIAFLHEELPKLKQDKSIIFNIEEQKNVCDIQRL
jgi:hypothetical protein